MYAKDLTPFQSVARTETNQHTLVSLTTDGSLPEIPHLKNWWLLLEEMRFLMQEILHYRTSHKPRTVRLVWFCLVLNTLMIKCALTRVSLCPRSQQIFTVCRSFFTSVASFVLYLHSTFSVYWSVQFLFLFGHHSFYCTWLLFKILRVLKHAASVSCYSIARSFVLTEIVNVYIFHVKIP